MAEPYCRPSRSDEPPPEQDGDEPDNLDGYTRRLIFDVLNEQHREITSEWPTLARQFGTDDLWSTLLECFRRARREATS
jgi:hypothetical protein